MGSFFGGSTTSETVPVGQLFDSGVFSKSGPNTKTRELSLEFLEQLRSSPFFASGNSKFGDLLKDQVNSLISGESQISENLRGSILDGAQSQFNARGLNRITENESLAALAPFELSAQDQALKTIMGLVSGRQGDQSLFLDLIKESRPDLLVGSKTTNTSNPSTIAKISAGLGLADQFGDFFGSEGTGGKILTGLG